MKQLLIASIVVTSFFAFSGCAHKKVAADSSTASTQTSSKKAAAASDGSAGVMTCTKDQDVRTLEVVAKDKGCELKYNKEGKDTVATTAKNGTKHCESSKEKIAKKLGTAGFKCAVAK